MTTIRKSLLSLLIAFALLFIAYFIGTSQQTYKAEASTIMGNDYNATSTAQNAMFGAQTSGNRVIKTGGGTIASVVITGANTGTLNFYDATTTNIDLRTGNTATTSILIASFPGSTAAGTYTLDIEFSTALLTDLYSGNMPTTTITYR